MDLSGPALWLTYTVSDKDIIAMLTRMLCLLSYFMKYRQAHVIAISV